MPQFGPVETLEEKCFNVTFKLLDIYFQPFIKSFPINGRAPFIHVIDVFTGVPPQVCAKFIERLKNERKLQRYHLESLLKSGILHLDLSSLPQNLLDAALILLGRKYQQNSESTLKRLDLSGNPNLGKVYVFSQSIPALKNLRELNLENCGKMNLDPILAILGAESGKSLKKLNLNHTKTSDSGLKSLENCVNLMHLSVLWTDVTEVDGICLILSQFPHLTHLDCLNSVEGLFALRHLRPDLEFNLDNLCIDEEVDDEKLNVVLFATPKVSKIRMKLGQNPNHHVFPLNQLRSLKEILLTSDQSGSLSVSALVSLTPMIKIHGESIAKIELIDVREVQIESLIANCPNLRILKLLQIFSFLEGPFYDHPECLEELRIDCQDNCNSPYSMDMLNLLSSSALKEIHLTKCQCLNMKTVENALNVHNFRFLESLHLAECHSIALDDLLPLISQVNNNPLKVVKLVNCNGIYRSDFDAYKKNLMRSGFKNVTVEWS